ncbi:helix-turn-helix domain-containing protein [Nostoc sp. DSM 114167]|jgi:transposase|uniref:helix-turn-helix domain-containing protein n=1 Tax=Nostoc sp. DSM 114167 TaxID=3439050 RepID=UPI004045D4B3
MCRVIKLEIKETQGELQELLRQQKTGYGKERIQALYLLKTRQVETVQHLAVVLGRGRMTVQRWLKLERVGGLSTLLELRKSPGRPKTISLEVRSRLKEELKDSLGFQSYEEVRRWLLASEGIEASYKVVHEVVRYKLKAKLKAPRPRSVKQNPGVEEDFKKNSHHGLS